MAIRFATFNASLNRATEGGLITDLSTPDSAQAQAIAEIIQRTSPDVILVNEFDFDAAGDAAALFQENYLSVSQNGVDPVDYPYVYAAPSNTGVPSGLDLNNDGTVGGPDDAYGFGFFPGQFAFVIYSKYPIVEDQIRTFQEFRWADMPGALLPADPEDADGNGDTASWFTTEELAAVRLSSKNHVDLPIEVGGEIIHVLASHPTPPVFDGPEDRNGRRNFDEIRFWSDYVSGEDYIYDDSGNFGGLTAGAKFVIMGDQNSDPFDGDSISGAAQQLLDNPLINTSITPSSAGGPDAAIRQGGVNGSHVGDPAFDTADFGFDPADPTTDTTPGNLRVDYVLPSQNLGITEAQVFWQPSDAPLFPLAEFPTSDHRLVYVDVEDTLPNGVASGDVTQDSVVLWARSTVAGGVTFEYSTEADFSNLAGSVTISVTDGIVPVKVEVDSLEAGTDYYYRVTDAAGTTKTGQFETAAALGEQTGLRFGVSGDWRGELSPYPAISNADRQDLAFFVEHGDTIYADFPSPAVPQPQATTLEDYRAKHSEVYSDRFGSNTWADLRAATAIYATIDDHEVINDFSGGELTGSDPRLLEAFPGDDPNALVNDSSLFENGLQAFQEYNPIRDEFYGETGDDRTANERKLYRASTFGSDAATFVLDTRSFRDAPLVAPDTTNPVDIGRFLTESATLDRPFLGAPQLEDLKADLLLAQDNGITWKFVMVPEPIQELGIYNVDAFEGYARERTEILKFIEENGIDNVVFIAADIHGTFVNNLTYTEEVGGPRIATDVWEITTGSVAFDAPFGPTVIDVATATGLLAPEQRAVYDSLPIAPDTDDVLNDKDDFLKFAFESLAIGPGGYDPIGLNTNLTADQGVIGSFDIEANLLQGDYVAAHTYGWTQFDIDSETQALTVTTYGIEPYTEVELLADPEAILGRTPAIVSQFEVLPTEVAPAPRAELIDLTGLDSNVAVNVTVTREARFNNVLKFYQTDAQGSVDGLMVGDNGYDAAVLANLVEAELAVKNGASADRTLTLAGGAYYAPVLLIDGDIDNLATLGQSRIQRSNNVWSFEDLTDNDFNDLIVTINSVESGVA
ncbi:alkaline phosphatase D family protein [Nodosilinea sp. LEGE 07088]|uniref:alkaline phosphatase D family protein n=1 Tax=Nodosilinea sp. LEGE 07088 TaxID=2777968 RepID=UPI0018828617|nr:alkaline phosphatase D family protein [Nodosilinea sp. LEGE 07088]MBE9137838.1 alkaline phosphatase D family protein [Nodosilinea sp. LEGE 07088]